MINKMFNYEQWSDVTLNSLSGVGVKILSFIPNFLGALVIILLGWLVSWLLEKGFARLFKFIGLDKLASRLKFDIGLKHAHIKKTTSQILAVIIYWIVFLLFITSALDTLGLEVVSQSIDSLLAYIPDVIAGLLIILIGVLIANFSRDFVMTTAASAKISYAKTLSKITQWVLLIFIIVIALNQVGINTAIFSANLTVIVAGIVAILVLAVGLGAKTVVANVIASFYLQKAYAVGDKVNVNGVSGEISDINSVSVVIKTKDGAVTVPAIQMFQEKR